MSSNFRFPAHLRDRFPFSLFFHLPNPQTTGLIAAVSTFLFMFWVAAFLFAKVFFPEANLNPFSVFGSSSAADVLPSSCPRYGRRYGVMFDAGSTGSRVHVYDFTFEFDGTVKLHNELFEQVKPGLSSYKGRPQEAAKSIDSLLEKAIAAVPEHARPCTVVELKATAGLRLLGPEASEEILEAIDKLFRTETTFFVPRRAAIVMDGKDEGPYAWTSVNFLLGTLFDTTKKGGPPSSSKSSSADSMLMTGQHPVAVLDMGGASTQIVFLPTTESARQSIPPQNLYRVSLFGKDHSVYQHSHLGYGLKEAGKSIAAMAPDADGFECFPAGYGNFKDHNGRIVSNKKNALQSFTICAQYVRKFLRKSAPCHHSHCSFNGVFQPNIATDFAGGEVFIFSYFFDRIHDWRPENGKMTVGDYKRIGRMVCESAQLQQESEDEKLAAKKNLGTECMDFVFLYEILSTGYDFKDSQVIHIHDKINDVEAAWTLGAMISVMQ